MNTTSVVVSVSRRAGGLQHSVRRLHQCLNDIPGMRVSIAALKDEFTSEDVLEWSPLPVSLSPIIGPSAFGFSPQMSLKLQAEPVDIVHTHGIWQYPSVAVSRWHRSTRKPYLVSPHGMLDPWAVRNSGWKKRIALAAYERRHLEEAACIRALCDAEARAVRAFGLQNPICVIPNGTDLPDETSSKSSGCVPWSSAIAAGEKVLLYLGRLHPKKGLANLLKAWSKCQKSEGRGQRAKSREQQTWVLVIAGWDQGGHEAELQKLATELGINWTSTQDTGAAVSVCPSVVFVGPQFGKDKVACYANCDGFVLPSVSEGLPMVILEAWAYAKPVLMTPECNLPEGFTARAAMRMETTVESIETGLKGFLGMPIPARQQMGASGRDLIVQRFNWPAVAREMASVYHWLLGNGAKPGCVIE